MTTSSSKDDASTTAQQTSSAVPPQVADPAATTTTTTTTPTASHTKGKQDNVATSSPPVITSATADPPPPVSQQTTTPPTPTTAQPVTTPPPGITSPTPTTTLAKAGKGAQSYTTASPITTTKVWTTTSGGATLTVTSVSTISGVATTSSIPGVNKGFFQNKGALVGILIAIIIVIAALLTFVVVYTVRRRRRARRFERDLNEATLEAATTRLPDFLDSEDRDNWNQARSNSQLTSEPSVYSLSSLGTYGQPPRSHSPEESYRLSELVPVYSQDYSVTGAGVAGFGTPASRARPRSKSNVGYGTRLPGLADAYAGYPLPQHPPQMQEVGSGVGVARGPSRARQRSLDAQVEGHHHHHHHYQLSDTVSNSSLADSTSYASSSSSHYQPAPSGWQYPRPLLSAPARRQERLKKAVAPPLPNSHESQVEEDEIVVAGRDWGGGGGRVLKVANE